MKIWEIVFSKNGEFNKVSLREFYKIEGINFACSILKVTKVMDLKGHSAAVLSLTFSQDSKWYHFLRMIIL